MDKIFMKNLLADGIIGVIPDELGREQDILINITIFTDTRRTADSRSASPRSGRYLPGEKQRGKNNCPRGETGGCVVYRVGWN